MGNVSSKYEDYFVHLKKISLLGRIYKTFFSSPILYFCARHFGKRIVEIGSGTGSGVLGAFPRQVVGMEINPVAVEYCRSKGLNVELIVDGEAFPVPDGQFDTCILDNVLEHIDDPSHTLDECYRITRQGGGLVIVVPGMRGYNSDADHMKFYDENALRQLGSGWQLERLFSLPFIFSSEKLSRSIKQYCLVATYKKSR